MGRAAADFRQAARNALQHSRRPHCGARALDGYAGTGAIGIEALSRGAPCHFIELEADASRALIERNLAHCGIADGYAIIRQTVALGLERLRGQPAFDIILLDPPYTNGTIAEADGPLAAAAGVMAADGVLILEHARKRRAPETAGRLVRSREVSSGDSVLSFYEVRS